MSPLPVRLRISRQLALATVIFGILFYLFGAQLKPGYSSAAQFISELNATGTAWAAMLGLFGFMPLGLLFAAFMIVARPQAQVRGTSLAGWWLLWSQPIAFASVAAFPCDLGCPVGGSFNQAMHDLFGVTTYSAGALGLFLLSFAPPLRTSHALSRLCLRGSGLLFIALFALMLDPGLVHVRGLLQRVADALLGLSLLVIAWRIVTPIPDDPV